MEIVDNIHVPYSGDIDQKTFDAMINLINSSKYYPLILEKRNKEVDEIINNSEKSKKKRNVASNNNILKELLKRQLKNIPMEKKLQYQDLKRICKYIDTSIFDENTCCFWKGYVTNSNKLDKGTYINFYFKKKKAALHRLLYLNFVGELGDDEYLKYNCENKGVCCNIKHIKKFKYLKKNEEEPKEKKPKSKNILPNIINDDNFEIFFD